MAGFRDTRTVLMYAYLEDFIDEMEFCALYDENLSHNLDFPYWIHDRFDLEAMDDAECWSEFRFYKNDIFRLKDALRIPDIVRTENRHRVEGIEALCIFLKRFA